MKQTKLNTTAQASRWGMTLTARLGTLAAAACLTAQIGTVCADQQISREQLLDKIRGGWAGQMIGVAYGAPTEFRAMGKVYEEPLPWKTGRLENALHQDDLYVEMTFAAVMDRLGIDATSKDYGRAFKDSKYGLWHANGGARRVLNQGIDAPLSGDPRYNFHANDIDFQIEADFIGLMTPGLPQTSNKLCDRVGRVMNYGDGLYGGMFVCGMYSAAYFESDPRKVVEAGLACIPAKSEYALLVRDLLDWAAQNPGDWRKVWKMVEEKWNKDDACPDPNDAQELFNIDAKLNGAYIAFGLLYGGGDFQKTMEIATRCGQDSDCNPSSAAGVLGVILGFNKIPEEFRGDLPSLADKKFDFTVYSFNEIVKSTEKRALQAVEKAGGKVTDSTVTVREQKPKAPKLEQWSPGIPDRKVGVKDMVWSFNSGWAADKDSMKSTAPGAEATFKFNGVAVAIMGKLDQNGGQSEVYLDGKKQEQRMDSYIVDNTYDTVLWQTYGLKPGDHTLKIVTLGKADPRSKGQQVTIQQAVVYRKDK